MKILMLAAFMILALGCYEPPSPTPTRTVLLNPAYSRAVPVACTGSMYPAIECGDRVAIKKSLDDADLTEGAIVQFVPMACSDKDPSWYAVDTVLHRIVYVSSPDDDGRRRYLTRGDNNSAHDCLVSPLHILGVVTAIYAPDGTEKPLLRE